MSKLVPLPESNETHELRVLSVVVKPKGEPTYSERATFIEVEDSGAGEYVKVWQNDSHLSLAKSIAIDPDEWPMIRDAIDSMLSRCRSDSDG